MKKHVSLLLILCMVISLTGCADSGTGQTASRSVYEEAGIDLSETVTLHGYVIGTPNRDFNKVWEKVNAMLLEDLNCTMEITYMSWGEYQSLYPLIVSSGDNIDWIFTGHWCMYSEQASRGAFREITRDEIKTYMPAMYELLPELAYKQCSYDGKLYMIPSSSRDKKTDVMILRADLAEKYGVDLSSIHRFSDIDPYLKAIKDNEPDMIPIYLNNSDGLWVALADESDGKLTDSYGIGCYYSFDGNKRPDGVYSMFDDVIFESVKRASRIMNTWYQKGYVNPEVLANKVTTRVTFPQGKSGVCMGNFLDVQSVLAECDSKGWNTRILLETNANGHSANESYSNNGIAISFSSQNPERTMMALDLIMNDERYINLIQFGIEGEHYILNEDGRVDYPEGVDASTTGYNWEETGFWFLNRDKEPPRATWSKEYEHLQEKMVSQVLKDNPCQGFQFNVDPVREEYTAVRDVMTRYHRPIQLGMVDDIDAAYEDLKVRLYDAGYERLLQEYQTQIEAYRKQLGY
ncbi:MAG: ABC transporter substrate-binding protein [Lachnospiraceae bacterium]|nr:ABC transporter substrate-binding protein [Lachnospiraceae bacterium]